ncbi:MAG: hypothetical protein NWE95_00850 [Candidatus Bathyarchaeota archaeon]|nr:hypothetical protein [Candidatus Bathyarchaeota archaeon]
MSQEKDACMKAILKFLYDVHESARSLKNNRASISELKQALKKLGYKEQEIVSKLDFLIEAGWIKVEKDEYEFTTPRGFTRKGVKEYYKISDTGINYFAGPSEFQRVEKSISGININNVNGVTIVGDSNYVVNKQYLDLFRSLSFLSEVVRTSSELTDEEKLNYVKDMETIKDQLSKPSPDKSIIRLAWEKLKPLATVEGIVSFFKYASEAIGALLK